MVKINQPAPNFSLPDQNGDMHQLSGYRGKWVLLYFYPKDDTPGCTTQACGIRDQWSEFKKAGLTVLGISADNIKHHQKFAQKYDLPFTLLSDEDKKVLTEYGSWGQKSMFGKKYMGILRNSFLIDPDGKIAKINEKVKPEKHVEEVLKDLAVLI